MKKIKIQPKEQEDFTLPYPYFIDEKGLVGRQDFWKGKPYKLLGFSKVPIAGTIELSFKDFWKNSKKAIGMFPVFKDKKYNWTTSTIAIESIDKILK